ncbi:MAG: hypothetical protein LBD24_02735 [Spirochaetaceae bacterium]|jgi:hypothetical protein|nr:hypothetical protein [Spirochaetaceae bacterium]
MNKVNEKIAEATDEITQKPSAEAHERRGDLYTGEGRHGEAAGDYHQATLLDNSNVKLHKKRLDALRNDLRSNGMNKMFTTIKDLVVTNKQGISISFPCNQCGKPVNEDYPLPRLNGQNQPGPAQSEHTALCLSCKKSYEITLQVDASSSTQGTVYINPCVEALTLQPHEEATV